MHLNKNEYGHYGLVFYYVHDRINFCKIEAELIS